MDSDQIANETHVNLHSSTTRVRFLDATYESLAELQLPVVPRNSEVVFVRGNRYVVVSHHWHVDVGVFGEYVVYVDVILSSRENAY